MKTLGVSIVAILALSELSAAALLDVPTIADITSNVPEGMPQGAVNLAANAAKLYEKVSAYCASQTKSGRCKNYKQKHPLQGNQKIAMCLWSQKTCSVSPNFWPDECVDPAMGSLLSPPPNACMDAIFACSTFDKKKTVCNKTPYCA